MDHPNIARVLYSKDRKRGRRERPEMALCPVGRDWALRSRIPTA
jgi:hypothetical protein